MTYKSFIVYGEVRQYRLTFVHRDDDDNDDDEDDDDNDDDDEDEDEDEADDEYDDDQGPTEKNRAPPQS